MSTDTQHTKLPAPTRRRPTAQQMRRGLIAKRRLTLIRKCEELRKLGARVYLVMETSSRYHVYSSESSDSWPPTADRLEKNYPVPLQYSPECLAPKMSSGL
ncbi:uncharacterized protein FPRN_06968 [Fusarium proliferatum]|nr:uncharacterized protein FPRN_06968 [Fusarium proliferatum]